MRFILVLLYLILSFGLASAQSADDGTYKTVQAADKQACHDACFADLQCRGYAFMQPDVRKPAGACRLNDGGGSDPLFELPPPEPEIDDGTYREIDVTSKEACDALCADDLKCRGWSYRQPDTRSPAAVCRLNNGFGAQPLFPPTPPAPWDLKTAEADLNAYRRSEGLGEVTLNAKLIAASQAHSDDLSQTGNAAHEGSDGLFHDARLQRAGYDFRLALENVATGQRSWDAALQGWKDSPGHNANLLNPDVTEFGIALTYEPRTTYLTYWTMVLASPLR